jgi:hypothetical protein
MIMAQRFKGEPFDTDIEELSAQADERWALFQSPDPRGARASTRAYKTPITAASMGLSVFTLRHTPSCHRQRNGMTYVPT